VVSGPDHLAAIAPYAVDDAGDRLGTTSDRRFSDCAVDHSALGSFPRRSADEIRPTVRREPPQRL
jgi:hypothetical protein